MAYDSLIRRYKDQNSRTIFANFGWKNDGTENWDTPFQKLADRARKENWNFVNPEYRKADVNFPILQSYLNYTFLRIQQQGKVKLSADGTRACFNTGLQTPEGKDIFAIFYKARDAEARNFPDWSLYGYFDGYSDKVRDFEPLPDIATYVESPSDLIYDESYEFEINYEHIIQENMNRLPDVLLSNQTVARNAVEGAIRQLKEKLRRNYKLAIPHWYAEKVQLLLPLSITDDTTADVALVAEKDIQRKKYMIRTILTLEMAYLDARIICAPDRQWLNP